MKNLKTQFLVLMLSTLWFVTAAYGQITPSADAYTSTAAPNTKYGAAALLDVEGTSQTTYIQFNLSSIPSGYTSSDIAQATLKLYVNAVTTSGSLQVNYVGGAWSEATIDASNAPTLGTTIANNVAVSAKNQYILVDVTSALGEWLNGTQPNYGIALVGDSGVNVSFDSKENATTSHPPELDIVFASTSGAITGVSTVSGSGLTGGGTSGNLSLSLESCPAGQVLASNGPGSWGCAPVSGGGGISGTGTSGSLPVFNTTNSLTSSNVFQNGSNVGIGTQTPGATLDVNGSVNIGTTSSFNIGGNPFAFGSYTNGSVFLGFGNSPSTPTGNSNTAVGTLALSDEPSSGGHNTAIGYSALSYNTSGYYNVGLGAYSGQTIDYSPVTANNNTAVGAGAAFSTGTLTNATAIGSNAVVAAPNSLVLGSIAGQNSATSNVNVGIGTTKPGATLDVEAPSGSAPTVNFGSASNPAVFTVNGTANFNGAVNFADTTVGSSAISGSSTATSGYGSNGGSFATASSAGSGVVGQDFSNAGGYGGYFSSASTGGSGIWASNTTGGLAGYFTGPVAVTGNETVGGNLTASGVVTGSGFQIGSNLFDYGSPTNNDAFLGFAGNGTNPGSGNTASGWLALYSDTTGSFNTATGTYALENNTGQSNTASGVSALILNQTGNGSTANGEAALFYNTTGSYNSALGFSAGPDNTSLANASLNYATAIGAYSDVTQSNSLVLGSIVGLNGCSSSGTPACGNTRVGIGTTAPATTLDVEAPSGATPSVNFFGSSTSGTFNVNGATYIAGATTITGGLTVTGGCNGCGGGGGGSGTVTSVGSGLGLTGGPITGSGTLSINTGVVPQLNVANTFTTSQAITGNLTATGTVSGATLAGATVNATSGFDFNNALFAYGSGTSINDNAYFGFAGLSANATNPGDSNTAIGYHALDVNGKNNTGGNPLANSANTAVGANALLNNTLGNDNTAVGNSALEFVTTGGSNIAVGNSAGGAFTSSESNNIDIGNRGVVGDSGTIRIGTAGTHSTTVIAGNVGIGTQTPAVALDVEAASGTPAINFFTGSANPGNLTVNGSATVTNLTVSGTCTGCGSGGGGGGVSTVTAGTGLKGGGSTPTVTLAIDPSVVPSLATANTFTSSQTINVSSGNGVSAQSLASTGTGVLGTGNGSGVTGNSSSPTGSGVVAQNFSTSGNAYGVWAASSSSTGIGVYGSGAGTGVNGFSSGGIGVYGQSTNAQGVYGTGSTGVVGVATGGLNGPGGYFQGFGAAANSSLSGTAGAEAFGGQGDPDTGGSAGGAGVTGQGGNGSCNGAILCLEQDGPGGVFTGANGGHAGVGDGVVGIAGSGYAGSFTGDLYVSGSISAGTKDFKIDHPLDPANKYLVHASVESSEMKDIYDGNVTTDGDGQARVQLPEWFSALNKDFRYQLTVIGQFAQAIVAREIESNHFEIRTSLPNVKVSWQVTGVRHDAYAKANPLVVEQEKAPQLRGYYIHPEFYGAPAEKQIEWARHPEIMKRMKERSAKPLTR